MAIDVAELKSAMKDLLKEDPYFLKGIILDAISEDLMTKNEFAKMFEKLATKEDLKMLIEMFNKRFEAIDKRFENMQRYMEKRFEAIDKRFENMQRYMEKRFEAIDKRFEDMNKRFEAIDKRFENMQRYMEKRFEAIDKRFEDLQRYMNKRFEDINKRFEDMRYYIDRRIGFLEKLIVGFNLPILLLLLKLVLA